MNAPLSSSEPKFLTSYDDFERYPRNLLVKNCSDVKLNDYATSLSFKRDTWFGLENEIYMPTCDLNAARDGWTGFNVLSEARLQDWLGEEQPAAGPLTTTTATRWKFNKTNPRCRFVFIGAEHSRAPLQVTPRILQRLFSYHQVTPSYLDFLGVFGKQNRPKHTRFSSFRDQDLVSSSPPAVLNLPRLGRGGCSFQICYNLKSATKSMGDWTVRQAATHHQFDFENGNSLWIMAHGHWDLRDRINAITCPWLPGDHGLKFDTVADCFRSTFVIHQLFYEWSNRSWGEYLASVEDAVERLSGDAKLTMGRIWTVEDIVKAQTFEETANKITMHLESNTAILQALEQFYKDLDSNADFPLATECHGNLQSFVRQLHEEVTDLILQTKRSRLLVRITSDRKTLILQRLQAQTTAKAERLNLSMFNFSVMAQKETIAMRVMAGVTVLYLPATFVSSFFSTDVVKYQTQPQVNNGTGAFDKNYAGTFSNTAILRWTAVTLPLTAMTMLVGIWYYNSQKRHRDRQIQELMDIEKQG